MTCIRDIGVHLQASYYKRFNDARARIKQGEGTPTLYYAWIVRATQILSVHYHCSMCLVWYVPLCGMCQSRYHNVDKSSIISQGILFPIRPCIEAIFCNICPQGKSNRCTTHHISICDDHHVSGIPVTKGTHYSLVDRRITPELKMIALRVYAQLKRHQFTTSMSHDPFSDTSLLLHNRMTSRVSPSNFNESKARQ